MCPSAPVTAAPSRTWVPYRGQYYFRRFAVEQPDLNWENPDIRLDLEDYQDLEIHNIYRERTEMGYSHDDVMNSIWARGRDNGRTPMQWTGGWHAGFTTGTPWLSVNPNCVKINTQDELLDPDHEQVFACTRTTLDQQMLVACNFSGEAVAVDIPGGYWDAELLLTNYKPTPGLPKPYEAMILLK